MCPVFGARAHTHTHTHTHTHPWDVTYQEKSQISFHIPNLHGEFHDMNLQQSLLCQNPI